jgi:hypothetical protein
MSRPSNRPLFDNLGIIWWKLQVTNLIIVFFLYPPVYSSLLGPNILITSALWLGNIGRQRSVQAVWRILPLSLNTVSELCLTRYVQINLMALTCRPIFSYCLFIPSGLASGCVKEVPSFGNLLSYGFMHSNPPPQPKPRIVPWNVWRPLPPQSFKFHRTRKSYHEMLSNGILNNRRSTRQLQEYGSLKRTDAGAIERCKIS